MVSASGQKRAAFKLLSTAAVAALCAATVLWFGHLRLWLAVQPAGAAGRAAAAAASLQPGRPTLHLLEKQQEVRLSSTTQRVHGDAVHKLVLRLKPGSRSQWHALSRGASPPPTGSLAGGVTMERGSRRPCPCPTAAHSAGCQGAARVCCASPGLRSSPSQHPAVHHRGAWLPVPLLLLPSGVLCALGRQERMHTCALWLCLAGHQGSQGGPYAHCALACRLAGSSGCGMQGLGGLAGPACQAGGRPINQPTN